MHKQNQNQKHPFKVQGLTAGQTFITGLLGFLQDGVQAVTFNAVRPRWAEDVMARMLHHNRLDGKEQ